LGVLLDRMALCTVEAALQRLLSIEPKE
jgi:hypothetical protein